jgi:lipopolysaccharide transport system permease protein
VLFWHQHPDFGALLPYSLIALVIGILGYEWFQKTRKGFADVL